MKHFIHGVGVYHFSKRSSYGFKYVHSINYGRYKAFKELQHTIGDQQASQNIPIKKSPVLEAIKKYPQRISLAAGAFLSVQVTFIF